MSEVRDHFVYTAFDSEGAVLYVGCTKNIDARRRAHRWDSDWYPFAVRFHLAGPYTYEVGRRIERERLAIDRPLYAFHPARRTLLAITNRIEDRERARLVASGVSFEDAIQPAARLARQLTGCVKNRQPIYVSDQMIADAFEAEQRHQELMGGAA